MEMVLETIMTLTTIMMERQILTKQVVELYLMIILQFQEIWMEMANAMEWIWMMTEMDGRIPWRTIVASIQCPIPVLPLIWTEMANVTYWTTISMVMGGPMMKNQIAVQTN